ncbi:MAG: hypothetical protein ACKO0V_01855, partial [bacterium]
MRISALLIDRRKRLRFLGPAVSLIIIVAMIGPEIFRIYHGLIYYYIKIYVTGWKLEIFIDFILPLINFFCLVLFC